MIDSKEILNAFNYRHACKDFDPTKKISDEQFNIITESIRLSPSSFGLEPWKFLIIQNKDIREKLLENAWGGANKIDKASHLIVALTRTAKTLKANTGYVQQFLKDEKNLDDATLEAYDKFYSNFQANDFKLDNDDKITAWATRQAYIPLGNMMSVAAMLNIDSCAIEGFNQEKINLVLSKECFIDTSEFTVSYMVALGYRVSDPIRAKTRLSSEKVFTWFK